MIHLRESWEEPVEESDETETQLHQEKQRHSSRGTYDYPSMRQRQRPRQTGDSRETGKDRTGGYDRRPGRRPESNRIADPRQGYDAMDNPDMARALFAKITNILLNHEGNHLARLGTFMNVLTPTTNLTRDIINSIACPDDHERKPRHA